MKDLEISKELLSEVLGINTILMAPIIEPENKIGYLVYGSQNTPQEVRNNHKQINIYEFAFKCKEWVNKQEYWANSGYDNKYYCMLRDMPDNKWFYADTEVEAIFKACEWVLSEINK